MIKLSIFGFEYDTIFGDDTINIWYIENTKLFIKILNYFNLKINEKDNEEDNEIIIEENGKRLKINDNMYLLFDYFNIEYNSKKILKNLYFKIAENINKSDLIEFEKAKLNIRKFLIQEVNELPFEMTIKSDINLEDILKAYDVKVDNQCYTSILEKLEFIIDILSEFKIAKILILPKIKSYIEEEELVELYKYSKYKNIYLLIIEDKLIKKNLLYEKIYYIDNDFCEQKI